MVGVAAIVAGPLMKAPALVAVELLQGQPQVASLLTVGEVVTAEGFPSLRPLAERSVLPRVLPAICGD
jgi:hypothetical protein